MVLPLLKVGSLFIKSLAKPFSKQIKMVASKSPKFHASVVWVARGFYQVDLYLSKISGDSTRKAAQLNVNSAIDLGSEMASEFFLLSVAVGLLLFENKRSADKDKKKEETLNERFRVLEENVKQKSDEIDHLTKQIEVLYAENSTLRGKVEVPSKPPPPSPQYTSVLNKINNNNNNNSNNSNNNNLNLADSLLPRRSGQLVL